MMNKVRSKTKGISNKGRFGIQLSWLIQSVLVVAGIVIELVLAQSVYAAVFHIASGDVAGLINAINAANNNGQDNTINLAAGTYTLTAVDNDTDGPNGLPSITSKLTIEAEGAGTTIIERDARSSTPPFRIIHVAATAALTLSGLTVKGGFIACCNIVGGGIFNDGLLTITNSVVSDNSAAEGGWWRYRC